MLFHRRRFEVILTMIGMLLLTTVSSLLALPEASIPQGLMFLIDPTNRTGTQAVFSVLLLSGLAIGFLRHRDPTPLLFSLLGIGVLAVLSLQSMPALLPALCAVCFVIAGVWSVFVTSHGSNSENEPPRLDDFLNKTLLPSSKEKNEE